jgi:hypothetical protein
VAGENMLCKIDVKNMCEYIYRTGRLSPKDTDGRKNPVSSKIEKTKRKQGEHGVNAGSIRIMFKAICGITHLTFSLLYLIFIFIIAK